MDDFLKTYKNLKLLFEKKFKQIIDNSSLNKAPKKFREAVYYSLFTGGKRIRPSLILEISKLCKLKFKKSIFLAGAIECLHTYSLVHDDLPSMDDDDFRRNRPSSHKQYDESTAILVGDCLQALSFELLANSEASHSVIHYFSQAVGAFGMVGGQFMDIKQDKQTIEIKRFKEINFMKTGKLFKASLGLPLRFINAKKSLIQSYEKWGKDLGLLFQLTDDLEENHKQKKKIESSPKRSLNILDLVYSEKVWDIVHKLEKDLSKEAKKLFPESIFLQKISHFILTRVK